MPIEKVSLKGIKGFRYGKHGKIYTGSNAREKARKQGQAIEISKRRQAGENIPIKADDKKRGTIRRL